jgi:hypothetical protein
MAKQGKSKKRAALQQARFHTHHRIAPYPVTSPVVIHRQSLCPDSLGSGSGSGQGSLGLLISPSPWLELTLQDAKQGTYIIKNWNLVFTRRNRDRDKREKQMYDKVKGAKRVRAKTNKGFKGKKSTGVGL